MNRRGPLVAGIASAAVVLLAAMLVVLPKVHQVGKVRDDLAAAGDQGVSLQAQVEALQQAEAAAPMTQKQIKQIEEKIPNSADLPTLFELLQGAADRSAVDFFSFSPGTPVTDASANFSTLSSAISVTGSYLSVDEFLYLLEVLPRLAKVTAISLTPQGSSDTTTGSSTGLIQMQVTIEFYTTDTSAGPGSVPGPTEGSVPIALPTESPAPEAPASETLPPATPSPTPGA